MNRIVCHTILIAIGFCGIFLGTLPDLFPQLISLPPNLKQYDYALETLTIKDEDDNASKRLKVGDIGYKQIYNLIRSFDPVTMPPLSETITKSKEQKGFGTIASIRGGMKWRPKTSQFESEKSIDPFLFVCFKAERKIYEPICQMNDLLSLVREAKMRFWSRFGFFFAFVALLLGEGTALRDSVKAKNNMDEIYPDYTI
jgi:hypothetical protein